MEQHAHKERVSFLDWQKHQERLEHTANVLIPKVKRVDPKSASIMETCGNFVYVCQCNHCRTKHYAGAHRCRKRFCLECAHQRSMAYVAKMMEKIVPLIEEGYHLHMLTFTIRDGPDLPHLVERLKIAWRVISHGRGTRDKFKRRMVGGFRTFEIKIGRGSKQWHPHMHALFLTPPGEFEKDYEWLKPAWKNATCGDGSIEIHKIKQRKGQALGILKAVIETAKYVTSPDKLTLDLDTERFKDMYLFMKGFRSVNSWGKLRGVVKEAEEADNIDFDEKKLADFVCQLCGTTEAEFRVLWRETLRKSTLLDMK